MTAARLRVTAALVVAMGCIADDPAGGAGGTGTVSAQLSEFAIELGATSAPAGPVTFAVANRGSVVHEFVVLRTDLPADALPTDTGGGVEEEGEGLAVIDEIERIDPGAAAVLPVELEPGRYVVVCNLPGHYPSGMHAELTVG